MNRSEAISPHAPSIVSIVNPLVRRLIGAGVPFGPNGLLTVRGRRSGEFHTFPVAILELGGRRFVQSPFGEVNWVLNLRADGTAVLARGRTREEVVAVELAPEEAGPVLRDVLAPFLRMRIGAAYLGHYVHVRRDSPVEEFIEQGRTHPTFELRRRA